jgi:signal transduction histidine kinase
VADPNARSPLTFADAPMPVWIYAPDANAFRWANAAGLAFWGAADLAAFRATDLSDIRPVTRRRLHSVMARLADAPSTTETWTVYPQGTPRTVVCTHWRVDWQGEACMAILAIPNVESETQADLRVRDRVLEAVAQSAERLLHGQDRLRERDRLLRELGEATRVDRAYAFDFHTADFNTADFRANQPGDGDPPASSAWVASQVFEWCSEGVRPEIDNPDLQGIDMAAHFPRWVARFRDGLPVVAAGPEQFPAAEWEILGPQRIAALCVHPVLVDGRPIGFIGFDIVDRPDQPSFPGWTQHLVDALATAAHLMAGAHRMEAALRQLRQASQEACAASRAKSDFLANMSHELRTPLNAIIGFSDVLRHEMLGPVGAPRYRTYADDIHASGQHLLGLISDVLDHVKAESGAARLFEETGELRDDVIAPSVRLIADRAAREQVTIQVAEPLPQVAVTGDLRKLVQVLINLLSNAVKFSDPDTRVDLDARLLGDGRLAIEVRDQGCGMSEADVARALEPFTQVGGPNRRHHEGTGLGLSLARQLSELHGGELAVESELGVGTTVRVLLPSSRVATAMHDTPDGPIGTDRVRPPASGRQAGLEQNQ